MQLGIKKAIGNPLAGVFGVIVSGYFDMLVTMRGVYWCGFKCERSPFIYGWLQSGNWYYMAIQMGLMFFLLALSYVMFSFLIEKYGRKGVAFMWLFVVFVSLIGWVSWLPTPWV